MDGRYAPQFGGTIIHNWQTLARVLPPNLTPIGLVGEPVQLFVQLVADCLGTDADGGWAHKTAYRPRSLPVTIHYLGISSIFFQTTAATNPACQQSITPRMGSNL